MVQTFLETRCGISCFLECWLKRAQGDWFNLILFALNFWFSGAGVYLIQLIATTH